MGARCGMLPLGKRLKAANLMRLAAFMPGGQTLAWVGCSNGFLKAFFTSKD